MSDYSRKMRDFILDNIDLGLPRGIELAEADDGAITVSIRVGQHATQKELKALIPYAIKWRDAAFQWNGGYRKDWQHWEIESQYKMHTSAGGRYSYSQIAYYTSSSIELYIALGEWDNARETLIDVWHFSKEETDDLLNEIARPRMAEGLPPFPEGYPPVTAEKVKRRLRTWREQREP